MTDDVHGVNMDGAPYHHGNLRATAIAAGLALLDAEPDSDLGWRAVAARAGVSPAALYRHFPDHRALRAALATEGFVALRAALLAAAPGGPAMARLGQLAQAYLTFAAARPGVYRLIFAQNHFGGPGDPPLLAAAVAAFAVLETAVAAAPGAAARADPHGQATALWAALHGAAMLHQVRLISAGRPADAQARDAIARAVALRAVAALAGTDATGGGA
jgi:AcrR family transcriptional regulator